MKFHEEYQFEDKDMVETREYEQIMKEERRKCSRQTRLTISGIIFFIGAFLLAHYLNPITAGLPTIQKMQSVIQDHPYGDAVTVIEFYPKEVKLHLWIDAPLTEPTDYNCQMFAQIIWRLMMLDSRLIIVVDGEFVPSRQNPIDFSWAKVLMEAGI